MSTPTTTAASMRGDLRTLARGGSLNLVGAIVNGGFGFALVAIIARGLSGPGATGAFLEAVALFNIGARLTQLGAGTALVRFIPRNQVLGRRGELRRSIAIGLIPVVAISTLAGAAVALLAPWLAALLSDEASHAADLTAYLRILGAFLPVTAVFTVLVTATRGFQTMLPAVALDNIVRPALQPLLVLAVFALGLGPLALGLAWALPTLLGLVAAAWWLAALVRRAESSTPATEETERRDLAAMASEFWRFAAPRALAGFFGITILWLDTLLLGGLRGSEEAGIYAASTRYLVLGTFVHVAIMQAVQPKVAELLALRDRGRAKSVFQTATAWLVTITWPLYLTVAIFSPVLLRVFGPQYVAGHTALTILATTWLFATAVGPVDSVLVMGGRSAWSMINLGVALAANVALNLWLIPDHGVTGAAIAWSASLVINNALPLVQVGRAMRLHPFGRGFRLAAPAALLCFGVIGLTARLTLGATIPVAIGSVALSAALYALILARLRRDLDLATLLTSLRRRGSRTPAAAGSEVPDAI